MINLPGISEGILPIWHKDVDFILSFRMSPEIFFPHDAQEQGTRRQHDSEIGQYPRMPVSLQVINDPFKIRMMWSRAHGVV